MSVKSDKLNRNQQRVIKALLEHRTIEEAAQAANISSRTLYRWLQSPIFSSALSRAESNLIDESVRMLISDMKENLTVMQEIRDDEKTPISIRLRAAQNIDASLLRWHTLQDIESRIESIERIING